MFARELAELLLRTPDAEVVVDEIFAVPTLRVVKVYESPMRGSLVEMDNASPPQLRKALEDINTTNIPEKFAELKKQDEDLRAKNPHLAALLDELPGNSPLASIERFTQHVYAERDKIVAELAAMDNSREVVAVSFEEEPQPSDEPMIDPLGAVANDLPV